MQSAGNILGSAMIQFTDVSVRFGDRQILKNISMTVPFGETLAILGGSGAGKTTILRLIEGLWQPDTGSIMIDGQEIVGLSEHQMTRVRNRMALVFLRRQGNRRGRGMGLVPVTSYSLGRRIGWTTA
jgi:ABC-type transporter Mla maintaining outer membrane lipid asymmetry ATPase subunit MlaF